MDACLGPLPVPGSLSCSGRKPMGVLRLRPAALATTLVTVLFASAGCGAFDDSSDGGDGGAPADEGPEKARALVQAYLDAVVAKDPAVGREQLCPPLREAFDRSATGPNGDFAEHFTVSEVAITDVRAKDATHQEVSTVIRTEVEEEEGRVRLLFTVARTEQGWCIADERPGGNPSSESIDSSTSPAAG